MFVFMAKQGDSRRQANDNIHFAISKSSFDWNGKLRLTPMSLEKWFNLATQFNMFGVTSRLKYILLTHEQPNFFFIFTIWLTNVQKNAFVCPETPPSKQSEHYQAGWSLWVPLLQMALSLTVCLLSTYYVLVPRDKGGYDTQKSFLHGAFFRTFIVRSCFHVLFDFIPKQTFDARTIISLFLYTGNPRRREVKDFSKDNSS